MTRAYITTSWDDGHPADQRLAALLEKHGLAGTFYIPRSIESGVMTRQCLVDIASRFEVGAHTLNHRFLTEVDDATAKAEIDGSRKWVQDQTGQGCLMFCPPAGRFNSRHWQMLGSAGYTGARTVELFSLSRPRATGPVMEMPTTLQAFSHPVRNYLKNVAKRKAAGNLWNYAIVGHSTDWPVIARRLLERVLQAGGVFHLWGHSWELEQTAQWERLEGVLDFMGAASRRNRDVECLTNGQICEIFSNQGQAPARGAN